MDEKLNSLKVGLPYQYYIKDMYLAKAFSELMDWIPPHCVLKGGTALNYGYLHKRFSEDIDLDCFGPLPKPTSSIFSIDGPWRFKDIVRYSLQYEHSNWKDNIRLDIKLMPKQEFSKYITRAKLSFFSGSVIAGITTYKPELLLLQKIRAISSRTEGKDYFDLYHGLHLFPLNKAHLDLFKPFFGEYDFIKTAFQNINEVSLKELSKSNRYTPRPERIPWIEVKKYLVAKIKGLASIDLG